MWLQMFFTHKYKTINLHRKFERLLVLKNYIDFEIIGKIRQSLDFNETFPTYSEIIEINFEMFQMIAIY